MITLYQFSPVWDLPNLSPFCIKVETYLRMTGIAYQARVANPRRAPKEKLPFIKDGDVIVADSGFILEYLKAKYGDPLDTQLSREEKSIGYAFQRLFEENLYWVGVHIRWIDPAGWTLASRDYFPGLKGWKRKPIMMLARKGMARALWAHGMGRHGPSEIYAIGKRDLEAVSAFLGSKEYFLGAQPTSYDAIAYGFLVSFLRDPINSELKRATANLRNLYDYCDRMQARYWKS